MSDARTAGPFTQGQRMRRRRAWDGPDRSYRSRRCHRRVGCTGQRRLGERYCDHHLGRGVTQRGPCANRSTTAPWMGTHGDAQGPGGQSFFTDATGMLVMAYHAWGRTVGYEDGGVRALWTDTIDFASGLPIIG